MSTAAPGATAPPPDDSATATYDGESSSSNVSGSACQTADVSQCYYTLDDIVERIGFGRFHWKLLVLCGVGYFAEITELVVVSFVAPSIQKQMGLNNVQYGMLGSSSFVGMAVGAFFWGYVSDHCGRQLSFALTVWLTFFGGFLSAFAPSYWLLLLLRFTAAFGIGGMLPVDYTVFLEFLPSHQRGSSIVLVDAIGVVPALTLSATIAWYFSGDAQVQWRYVLLIASIPVGIMGILRRHVPESPRYYLAAGNLDAAQQVVQAVADENRVTLPYNWKLVAVTVPLASTATTMPSSKQPTDALPTASTAAAPTEQDSLSRSVNYSPDAEATAPDDSYDPDDDDVQQSIPSNWQAHQEAYDLFRGSLRGITARLWPLYFLLQFASAGMVFALPKLFDEFFPGKTEKAIALDLLLGVVGLIPGLMIAYVAVEYSRTKMLGAFFLASGLSVLMLGATLLRWKAHIGALIMSAILRGSMEGCFALLNTAAVESYPTTLRATGLGTAQIFDHIAGSFSPVVFSALNGTPSTQPLVFFVYAMAYVLAIVPAVTLPDTAGRRVRDD